MKNFTLTVVLLLNTLCLFAQGNGQYLHHQIEVDDISRNYTLYVPDSYDGTEAWPLVFLFHGFKTSISDQIEISQMYLVADTAKFFVAYPQGLEVQSIIFDDNGNGWNTPGTYSGTHNDVNFISAMIKDLDAHSDFNIDVSQVYASGWSNGGEMALYLGCALPDQIAAIASVANPMTEALVNYCAFTRPISVLYIQGTDDIFFPGAGVYPWLPCEETTQYWAEKNDCDVAPHIMHLKDVDTTDHSTVTRYSYENCENGVETKAYIVHGGGHNWPGGTLPDEYASDLGNINQDFSASEKIWTFFRRNGHPAITSTYEVSQSVDFHLFPNPVRENLTIDLEIQEGGMGNLHLLNTLGQEVAAKNLGRLSVGNQQWNWKLNSSMANGIYFVELRIDGRKERMETIIVER